MSVRTHLGVNHHSLVLPTSRDEQQQPWLGRLKHRNRFSKAVVVAEVRLPCFVNH